MKFIPFFLFVGFLVLGPTLLGQDTIEVTLVSGEVLSGELDSNLDNINKDGVSFSKDGNTFTYSGSEVSSVTTSDARHFFQFILEVDQKSHVTSQLSQDKEPEFNTDTVLLEEIVSGPMNLFRLVDRNKREHFFLQRGTNIPEELVYTRYVQYDENGRALPVKENNRFRNQLSGALGPCGSVFSLINEAEYDWEDLVKIIRTGSMECLGATEDQLTIATVPRSLFETELTAGIGTGYLHLLGGQYPFEVSESTTRLKPGYFGSVAFAYYPAALKGGIAFITEVGLFTLNQTITAEDYTSENIYKNYRQQIDYQYLSLNLILRQRLTGKNNPFWQIGYSYGYAYRQLNPLEEEIFFFGTLRSETEPQGFPTANQENALVVGGGIMPGKFIIKLAGRISNGSTSLPTQSSLHLLGHLCLGYKL